MISLLAAMAHNQVIGKDNDLPWHLPNDLMFFKKVTTGHTIVMGRKTFDSIGKPLPGRSNIVITKQNKAFPEGVRVWNNLDMLRQWNKENPDEEYFVIGGSSIFEQLIDEADRMYLTYIDERFAGDTYFPVFTLDKWSLTSKVKGPRNDNNPYDYYYLQYDRV